MTDTNHEHGLSVHRIDALTDGIYAVAMTLLVIELKLPEHALHDGAELGDALLALWPKFYAWFISFFALALFWMGHHRAHNHLRHTTGPLIVLNIGQLAFVSLMPFSCALLGEHASVLVQAIFAGNMAALALFPLLISRYIYAHPELTSVPMSRGTHRGALVRIGGLIVICGLTVLIQSMVDKNAYGFGNIAFMLMTVIMPLSRRVERASDPAAPGLAPG